VAGSIVLAISVREDAAVDTVSDESL